jgi:N-methylhydantoinase A
MLQTDMRHDVVRTFYEPLAVLDGVRVAEVYAELERESSELLAVESIPDADRYFARSADMRYVGQEYFVSVPVGPSVELVEIDRAFHEAHRVRYGHSTPGAPVEFVNLRVAGMGRIGVPAAPSRPAGGEDPSLGRRSVVFSGEARDTPVLLRDRLPPGPVHEGPLVIEEQSSTTVVPPGYTTRVDEHGNLLITRGDDAA